MFGGFFKKSSQKKSDFEIEEDNEPEGTNSLRNLQIILNIIRL